MRNGVIWLIRVYQYLAPKALRDRCIFKERCSDHVIRRAHEGGALAAVRAFQHRFRVCRPGYIALPSAEMFKGIRAPVRLADGSIIDQSELSERAAI